MTSSILTHEQLKEHIHYNAETGVFTRLKSPRTDRLGVITVKCLSHGYLAINVLKKEYFAHRLAYFYMTGELPKNSIDHINRVRADNRWCNLREATKTENSQNIIKPYSTNKSGYLGVHYCNRDKVFIAQIRFNGKKVKLGRFDNALDAYNCYLEAKKEHHSFYVA